uniref:VHS domain-containing protein n=1 Tax=Arcella intermedia TaxID=1963864 RepID=A0A6B2L353_9EUKA
MIEELTTTGEIGLDNERLRSLVPIAKKHLQTVFEILLVQLKKPHSQIRLLSWHLLSYLFSKSKLARSLTDENFSSILPYVIGHEVDKPLPGPDSFAKLVRDKSLEDLKVWIKKYPECGRIVRAEHYLSKQVLPTLIPISPDNVELLRRPQTNSSHLQQLQLQQQQQRIVEMRKLEANVNNEKYDLLLKTLEDKLCDIETNLDNMCNWLAMIFSFPEEEEIDFGGEEVKEAENVENELAEGDDFEGVDFEEDGAIDKEEVNTDEGKEDTTEVGVMVESYGLGNESYQLEVVLDAGDVSENEENQSILENLREGYKLFGNHLIFLSEAIDCAEKAKFEVEKDASRKTILSQLKLIFQRINDMILKCNSFNFINEAEKLSPVNEEPKTQQDSNPPPAETTTNTRKRERPPDKTQPNANKRKKSNLIPLKSKTPNTPKEKIKQCTVRIKEQKTKKVQRCLVRATPSIYLSVNSKK